MRLDDRGAATIAMLYCNGKGTALFNLSETGTILRDDCLREIVSMPQRSAEHEEELTALVAYIDQRGNRGPITDWPKLAIY